MEDCCRPSWLCCLTQLMVLAQLPTWASAQEFLVVGPSEPVMAVSGGEATLPCSVLPAMSVENMEVRWYRTKFSEAVLVYRDGQEQKEEQMAEYASRTSLVRDGFIHGKAAVRIRKVQVSDSGLYICFFQKGSFYEEAILELKVAGMGSVPQVYITGPEEDGVRVVCKTAGWFPRPQVQWKDSCGEKFLEFSEVHTQEAQQLFSMESSLVVRDSSTGNVTCCILNPMLGQEKTRSVFIPEPFFPQADTWMPVFVVSLMAVLLSLLGAGYFLRRERSMKVQMQKKQEDLRRTQEENEHTMTELQQSSGELLIELGRRKTAYLDAWRKAQLYAASVEPLSMDWRTERFQAWTITLDPLSAHSTLTVSRDRTRVTWKDSSAREQGTFSVLGFEGIASGRWYWEVHIKNAGSTKWSVGVCRADAERKNFYLELPKDGFWVMGRFDIGYCTFTDLGRVLLSLRKTPYRLGVFLDYDEGDISFYNMNDNSHIHSFHEASFSGNLHPYFRLKSGDVLLSTRPLENGYEEYPGSVNISPLGETQSSQEKRVHSDCGTVTSLPEAESPLLPPSQ